MLGAGALCCGFNAEERVLACGGTFESDDDAEDPVMEEWDIGAGLPFAVGAGSLCRSATDHWKIVLTRYRPLGRSESVGHLRDLRERVGLHEWESLVSQSRC